MVPCASATAKRSPIGHSAVTGPGIRDNTSSTVALIFNEDSCWKRSCGLCLDTKYRLYPHLRSAAKDRTQARDAVNIIFQEEIPPESRPIFPEICRIKQPGTRCGKSETGKAGRQEHQRLRPEAGRQTELERERAALYRSRCFRK